jgi:hypothetical protein
VGGEEWFLVLLVISFIRLEHSVEPRKKLLGAVVAMQNNGTTNPR